MNKLDLAERIARESHRSRAHAADDINRLVYRMLKGLRQLSAPISERLSSKDSGRLPNSARKGTREST